MQSHILCLSLSSICINLTFSNLALLFPVSDRTAVACWFGSLQRACTERKWSLLWVTLDAFPIKGWACCSKTGTAVVWRSGPAVSSKWLLRYKVINHRYGLCLLWLAMWHGLGGYRKLSDIVTWHLNVRACTFSMQCLPAASHWNSKPQERNRLAAKLSPLGFSIWIVHGV